jgi:hypothetical protein
LLYSLNAEFWKFLKVILTDGRWREGRVEQNAMSPQPEQQHNQCEKEYRVQPETLEAWGTHTKPR